MPKEIATERPIQRSHPGTLDFLQGTPGQFRDPSLHMHYPIETPPPSTGFQETPDRQRVFLASNQRTQANIKPETVIASLDKPRVPIRSLEEGLTINKYYNSLYGESIDVLEAGIKDKSMHPGNGIYSSHDIQTSSTGPSKGIDKEKTSAPKTTYTYSEAPLLRTEEQVLDIFNYEGNSKDLEIDGDIGHGFIVRRRDTRDVIGYGIGDGWRPKYEWNERTQQYDFKTDDTGRIEAGGPQTSDHLIHFRFRSEGEETARGYAQEVIASVRAGKPIPYGGEAYGNELEAQLISRDTGELVRAPDNWSDYLREPTLGMVEVAFQPTATAEQGIEMREQQIINFFKERPDIIVHSTSTPMTGSLEDSGAKVNDTDGYVMFAPITTI